MSSVLSTCTHAAYPISSNQLNNYNIAINLQIFPTHHPVHAANVNTNPKMHQLSEYDLLCKIMQVSA